jgi:hypothetical protein
MFGRGGALGLELGRLQVNREERKYYQSLHELIKFKLGLGTRGGGAKSTFVG